MKTGFKRWIANILLGVMLADELARICARERKVYGDGHVYKSEELLGI